MSNYPGFLINLEGGEGSGKTTQKRKLLNHLSGKYPSREIVDFREPGSTEVGEIVRDILLRRVEDMDLITEVLLYAAARSALFGGKIKPALEAGKGVVLDRGVFSSFAYQGYGRGADLDWIWTVNKKAVRGIIPDVIVYFNLPPTTGLKRIQGRELDRIERESIEFHERVARGYLELQNHPAFKGVYHVIDAIGSEEEVFERLKRVIDPVLEERLNL